MRQWRPTAALRRALLVSVLGLVLAVATSAPAAALLVLPLALVGALGLRFAPAGEPTPRTQLDHRVLHEGQSTRCRLVLGDTRGVEHVTRQVGQVQHVVVSPSHGCVGGLVDAAGPPVLTVSPRRWGGHHLGEERVALVSTWGGYRWGPAPVSGQHVVALPQRAPFDLRAEAPAPVGLVGAHRSRRVGSGMELAGIRPFGSGDRPRRISWRVSLRRQWPHVVEGLAESDTGVLLLVDALADLGASDGIDVDGGPGGRASSLDLAVRAAAALAEHHTRSGDRVALRVVGGSGQALRFGAGPRHLRMLLGALAELRPGGLVDPHVDGALRLQVAAGTQVVVLSPLLSPIVATTAALLAARGLPIVAIDTLPPVPSALSDPAPDPRVLALAWRLRTAERDLLREQLTRRGCPVVPWRGPGTLDDVLRRLARRAQLPQVGSR